MRNLEYLETVGPKGVNPKHMYKLIHESDLVPFFKKMVDRVVTSLLEIKEGNKKPTVELYEEIAQLQESIANKKEEDNGAEEE